MNKGKKLGIGVVLAFLMFPGFFPTRAQGPMELVSKVSFEFTAGETSFSPGKIHVQRKGFSTLLVQSLDGTSSVSLPIITKLSPRTDGSCLVFDKVGEKLVLSEIWFSNQEGFLVAATKEEHQHEIIK